jgi:hypothetical protein
MYLSRTETEPWIRLDEEEPAGYEDHHHH